MTQKVIAKVFVPAKTENGKVIEQGYYKEEEATLLHWGITYEELRDGVGQYTVVFVALTDGTVIELVPELIRIIN